MRRLLGVWGPFNQAVRDRVPTHELYDRLRDAFENEGARFTGISATDVSRLRGVAAAQRNAIERYSQLTTDQLIRAEHTAMDISSRSYDAHSAAPQWLVRYQANIVHEGESSTVWVTNVFTGILPRTRGEMDDQLSRDAARVIEDRNTTTLPSGATFTGLGDVSILWV
jgi:hypothetical protein